MADFITVLSLLADGRPRPVADLAQAAGLSAARVRRVVAALVAEGLPIETGDDVLVWRRPVALLDRDRIVAALPDEAARCFDGLELLAEVDSTSSRLIGDTSGGHGRVCVAERQTAGRGRRGNRWVAVPTASLCFSLRWHFDVGAAALGGLSLAVGIAVASVLRQRLGVAAGIKWPNDIYLDGRKLGGILVELPRVADRRCEAVIGIGLNVTLTCLDGIDQRWTSLHRHLPEPAVIDRNHLLAWLLDALARALPAIESDGGAWVRRRWAAFDISYGRPVRIHRDGEVVDGIGMGIDPAFRFLLRSGDGIDRFHSGEVSLRC